MAKSTAENTYLRLKTVLDVLTEGVWSGDALNAGQVLAEATARVPFNEHEAELLSGGIPRGHKTLTSATAKLVKAGWLIKGRSGWTITEDGMRATVAFPDVDSFAAALDAGTPVPADTPVPTAPEGFVRPVSAAAATLEVPAKEEAPKKAAKKAPAKKAASAVGKAAKALEEAVEPVVKAVRKGKSAPKDKTEAVAAPAETSTATGAAEPFEGPDVETLPQPEAVAVAGDFNTILGAPEDWAPQYDEAQMEFDFLDQLWKKSAELPAGYYTFKIALNRSWDENYGAFGTFDGPNHELHHAGGTVTIRYNHATRDITIN
ncbi:MULTISPECIES: pullulanase X25 domain-containing protein [unclassified Arthrobacter]|uniref:pullulanase X25 domain-containing protein n=1 Tax=unclassified Arthrobacter TaxID=235627 RepID=UPI001F178D54|nr:glycosidase [Arthrobacter sp. FW306-06-A]UKA72109.1 glycosidase [Arthrobacter sp. FW306-06-A]